MPFSVIRIRRMRLRRYARSRSRFLSRERAMRHGYGDVTGKTLALPVDRGPACRAEVEGEGVAALGRARPRGRPAGECDLLATEARLVADHSAGAALALQTVAHGDAHRLAFDGEVELAAAAGGSASGHRMLQSFRA